jgi:DNA polymerase-3 subunit delta'
MAAGSHPDWIHIRPEGASIKIQQIRELKKATSFPPLNAAQRIILIEDAHTMGREAGNSLLKVLEEPPPNNLFLLIASDTEALLATLISRCQIIPCTPLSPEHCVQVLQQSAPHLHLAEIQAMSKLAQGCPGQSSAFAKSEVLQLYQEAQAALLSSSSRKALALEQALALSGRLAQHKEESLLVLDLLAFFLQDCLRTQEPQDEQGRQARERWNISQLSAMLEALEQARSDFSRNCNRALVCDVLFLKLFCDFTKR